MVETMRDLIITRFAGVQYRKGHRPLGPQQIMMPCCGILIYFPTAKAIPKRSLRCPCGEKNFYIVYWDSE